LMTISVKKVSTSSKLTIVYLSCSPLCGLFSIQQNAKGDLSYKVRKEPLQKTLRFFLIIPVIILIDGLLECIIFSEL
ncbi:hypothetical protein FYJ75_06685, partial [Roseburia sp. MUC/MUC-530-WT-4D]|nr:hypothetical protein [Roseburia porci]